MTIEYGAPLSRALRRMKAALFNPFDPGKWFTLGFAAFLSGLTDGRGMNGNYKTDFRHADLRDIARAPGLAWTWLLDHSEWFALIVVGVVIVFVFVTLLVWLSSRGKFIFIANISEEKAEIVRPWNEYRREGNSLFLWRFFYGFIAFIVMAGAIVFSLALLYNFSHMRFQEPLGVFPLLGFGFGFFILIVIFSYIDCFLNSFIAPLMFSRRMGAIQAWSSFLSLFGRHPGHFLLYGLFRFVLNVLILIMIVSVGLFTCCIGFLLLLIPYIGSIILLPVSYTMRAFSLEYLEQFGPDYRFFAPAERSAATVS
ncbi:hypothetical protein JXO52_08355 [bacterium]|nr:hypothetical protein [bacterium]